MVAASVAAPGSPARIAAPKRAIRRELTEYEERIMSFIKIFLKDESGATMIEYGLVAALVSVAAIVALQLLGAQLQIIFNTVSSYLASASSGGS